LRASEKLEAALSITETRTRNASIETPVPVKIAGRAPNLATANTAIAQKRNDRNLIVLHVARTSSLDGSGELALFIRLLLKN
jgi:hypothetical protein